MQMHPRPHQGKSMSPHLIQKHPIIHQASKAIISREAAMAAKRAITPYA